MSLFKKVSIAVLILLCGVTLAAEFWKVKAEGSYITFSASSAVGMVHGKISGIQGEIKFDENDLEHSSFNTYVQSNHLDTKNKKRDDHLKSDDFLDVPKFPSIKFQSKKMEKKENGYVVTGNLTIKEITKEISFPFTFENKVQTGVFKGAFSINRRDYGVGGKTIFAGDKIDIEIVTVVNK